MSQDPKQAFLVSPDDGRALPGLRMVHKVAGERFGVPMLIMEGVLQPGQLIPPHTHSQEDECTHVVTGVLTFEVGGEVMTAPAGSYAVKPRGIPHAFWNAGTEPARVIEFHTPGGFDRFYDEFEAVFTSEETDEGARRAAEADLHARYGLTFHPERIPEIAARYGVRP